MQLYLMVHVSSTDIVEAEKLLNQVQSWSEEAVEELPKFYREKAREYRRLLHRGED